MDLYKMFKKPVFDWLDTISEGPNRPVVEQLMTKEGIMYTFGLPPKLANKMLSEWQSKQKVKME